MQATPPRFAKYIFVCENEREEGKCCSPDGSKLRELLKKTIKEKGLAGRIRVSRAGCLDVCAEGPNVLLMPDNRWFSHVEEKDIPEIIHAALHGLE